jgi:magnesium chelatase subunit H
VQVRRVLPGVTVSVFSDRDIRGPRSSLLEAALANADVFFGSLIFDYDDVEWVKERVADVPVKFAFESALELMSETKVGEFEMKPAPDGRKAGPPPAVKKILQLFGSRKEEDKLAVRCLFIDT